MTKCTDKEQIFDLVAQNEAILSEKQLGCALNMLAELQKQKTYTFQDVEYIRNHPQFLVLQNLTAKKIEIMNDGTLVNVLYATQQFAVEIHDPLVAVLTTEAWRRLERFDISVLAKFSTCLADQHLYSSPLMGKIADIVNRNLESIQDLRSLSVLMVNISSLISHGFQERLLKKSELLFDTIDLTTNSHFDVAKRIVIFLRKIRCSYYPLLERCNNVFLVSLNHLDLEVIRRILSLYYALQFYSLEFFIATKRKLTEMIPLLDQTVNVPNLFVALGPIAGPEEENQLESAMLLMSEELTSQQALTVIEAMAEMESRNSRLIKKIASVLNKHLDSYKPVELLKITRALTSLHFQSKEFFVNLRHLLCSYLKTSTVPGEIRNLVCAISILPSTHLDEAMISRIEAVLTQCDLYDINSLTTSVVRWIQNDPMCLRNITGKQLKLLKKLDDHGHQRLQNWHDLHALSQELKNIKGDLFAESLLEEAVAALQRLVHEMNYRNVVGIASFIAKTSYLSTSILDRIASVVIHDIEKIHPLELLTVILPFSILNYDPPLRDEFFGTCIQYLNSHLGILDPVMLVFLGFSLATLGYFPEDLIKAVFNIQFLAKLDSQLEILSSSLKRKIQYRFMELNRAVCLESPEYQIPWFHDRFCQRIYNKDFVSMTQAKQLMYKMITEVLGEINSVKALTRTPYYHLVDFECILDKRRKPIPYGNHNITFGKLPGMHWESDSQLVDSGLPPDAKRIAIQFLDSKAFCVNIPHLKGNSAMNKRHLEILGYQVIQIPYYEWNSMALSTEEARKNYLRDCIFGEAKS